MLQVWLLIELPLLSLFSLLFVPSSFQLRFGHPHKSIKFTIGLKHVNILINMTACILDTLSLTFGALGSYVAWVLYLYKRVLHQMVISHLCPMLGRLSLVSVVLKLHISFELLALGQSLDVIFLSGFKHLDFLLKRLSDQVILATRATIRRSWLSARARPFALLGYLFLNLLAFDRILTTCASSQLLSDLTTSLLGVVTRSTRDLCRCLIYTELTSLGY